MAATGADPAAAVLLLSDNAPSLKATLNGVIVLSPLVATNSAPVDDEDDELVQPVKPSSKSQNPITVSPQTLIPILSPRLQQPKTTRPKKAQTAPICVSGNTQEEQTSSATWSPGNPRKLPVFNRFVIGP